MHSVLATAHVCHFVDLPFVLLEFCWGQSCVLVSFGNFATIRLQLNFVWFVCITEP